MNCQEVRDLSSAYLDKELAPSEVASLEEHLRVCTACRHEVEALHTTISLIGSLDEVRTSADFLDQVQRKIEKRNGMARLRAWFFEPFQIKVPLEITALILLSIGAFQLFLRSPELAKEVGVAAPLEGLVVAGKKSQEEAQEKKAVGQESYKVAESVAQAPSAGAKPGRQIDLPKSDSASEQARDRVYQPEVKAAMPRSLEPSRESSVGFLSPDLKVTQDRAQHEAMEKKAKRQESGQIAKAPPIGATKPEMQTNLLEPLKQTRDEKAAAARQSKVPSEKTQREILGPGAAQGRPTVPSSLQPLTAARDRAVVKDLSPQVVEVVAEDVGAYESRVRLLLGELKGKLLAEDRASESALLLTVELPQSRQAEFLAALQQEAGTKSEPGASTRGVAGEGRLGSIEKEKGNKIDRLLPGEREPERKTAPALSYLRFGEPTVILQLRILQKKN